MNEVSARKEGGGGLCRPPSQASDGAQGVETGAGPAVIPTQQGRDSNLSEAGGTHGHHIK